MPFQDNTNLVELALRDNSLSAINKNLTTGLYNLQILNLAGNPISTIEAESFKDNRNLTQLLLFWDSLMVIQSLSKEINSKLLCGPSKVRNIHTVHNVNSLINAPGAMTSP